MVMLLSSPENNRSSKEIETSRDTRQKQKRLSRSRCSLLVFTIASGVYVTIFRGQTLQMGGPMLRLNYFKEIENAGEWSNLLQQIAIKNNVTNSLKTLMEAALQPSKNDYYLDHEINVTLEHERCERYGYEYNGRMTRRRVFWGSMIADESWHTIAIAAMEYYGILSAVALVESNATHMLDPREMRFPIGSNNLRILSSPLLWGPQAQVAVDYYYDPPSETRKYLERDQLQRETILKRWKANGMAPEDIGIVSDLDELASRDFLRALQICEVPSFAPNQDCIHSTKIVMSTLVFESSPLCLTRGRRWYHPDAIIGECIELIGNATIHPPVERSAMMRKDGWTEWAQGPLWTATDFRMTEDVGPRGMKEGQEGLHTAFHFHNFFDSIAILRRKYATYAEPVDNAASRPLSELSDDIGFMVMCLSGTNKLGKVLPEVSDYLSLDPNYIPVAFQHVPEYPSLRHNEFQQMLAQDERIHPPKSRHRRSII